MLPASGLLSCYVIRCRTAVRVIRTLVCQLERNAALASIMARFMLAIWSIDSMWACDMQLAAAAGFCRAGCRHSRTTWQAQPHLQRPQLLHEEGARSARIAAGSQGIPANTMRTLVCIFSVQRLVMSAGAALAEAL